MFNNYSKNLILILPLLFKYLFSIIFINWALFSLEDIIEDVFFLIIIYFFLHAKIIKKQFYVDIICLIYVFYIVLETTSYLAVSSNFSSSFMYILLESNSKELKEFSGSYISFPIIIFILFIVGMFFLIRRQNYHKQYSKYNKFYEMFAVVIIILGLKLTGGIESNAYHNVIRGVYGYIELQGNFKLSSNIKKEDVEILSNNDILVVVLGESTHRGNMQLYGYNRINTPNLNRLKGSLFIYSDVISSDVLTSKAVPKMLTSLESGSDNEEETNIIDVFNCADYNTYWLSNQKPIGYHENRISKIAAKSDTLKFFNHAHEDQTKHYDDILLPEYKKILKYKGKKIIFLRLMGTHFDYSQRYPLNFKKFIPNNTTKKEAIITHYDNAVLYNDYIVSEALKVLKESKGKRALIYLSDHGENVYHNETDFFGRTEKNLTKVMFDIPFIVWYSKEYELPKDFEFVPNRKFMTDNFYESLGHFFGVKYHDMDFTKSIFSNSFKEHNRVVVNGVNYDRTYEIKNDQKNMHINR